MKTNTFIQKSLINSFKVTKSIGWASLTVLSLPFFIISRKPFNFFSKKSVEVWKKNTTGTTEKVNKISVDISLKTTLKEWVEKAPEGENRILAQENILDFLELSTYCLFLNQNSDLNLSSLRLTSLPEIFNYPCFNESKVLILCENHLETLPESFSNLHALQGLNLMGSHLETLPESFGNLHALQRLNLMSSHLKTLPESFGNLYALQELVLTSNLLETLPESFGNLHALQKLYLTGNRLETLPESFGNLHALRELYLTGNRLETLPESFGSLHSLQELYLTGNCLEALPESIGQLQALITLMLDNNPFNGITDSILQLSSDCTIALTGYNLSRAILERLRERTSLSDYKGPHISYSIADRTNVIGKSIKDSLRELYQIIDKEPTKFANLPETEELRSWLNRLVDTADYKNETLQRAFAEKIIDYLNEANENTEFRRIFEAIIQDASATCGDRVALSVLHLSIAYQLATIDLKNMKQLDDFLTKGSWTIDLLEEIARNKILDLPFFDEIEVYLGYPIKLKQELDIPIDVQEMLYFQCSALKPKDLQEAKNFVLNKRKNREEHLEFLITNAKWQEALSVNYNKEYQSILDERTKAAELDNPDYSSIEKKYKQDLKALTLTALESQ